MSEPTNTYDYPSRAATPERIEEIAHRMLSPMVTYRENVRDDMPDLLNTAAAYHDVRPIAAALVAAWVDYCDADDNGWTERREQLADHIDGLMGQLREVIA